jgi:hypothetical protein
MLEAQEPQLPHKSKPHEEETNMTKAFWKSAGIRALRTVAQTAAAVIGTSAVLEQVNWWGVLSASVLAGILSILTSVATGLPEAPKGGDGNE